MLKTALEYIAISGRKTSPDRQLNQEKQSKLDHLKKHGYVVFDHLVGTDEFNLLKQDYKIRMEQGLEFTTPCLAQSKIDPIKHKDLIENNFFATLKQLTEHGLTFDQSDMESYEQVVSEYLPSTLTLNIPDQKKYFDLFFDENVLEVVSAYMGFTPLLVEAYIRRNFPARFQVMNHYWHRDLNHPTHLLKAFVFLSDCTLSTGPHHYIAGSIQDQQLTGKRYYTDQEVLEAYPKSSNREIISVVPAGTIILEDTRGLHKAGTPEEGYRDLAYSVFLPPVFLKPPHQLYQISQNTYKLLSKQQKLFLPKNNIL